MTIVRSSCYWAAALWLAFVSQLPLHVHAETVQFPGEGLTLTGEILRPAGAGPFPAVVALHGCNGLGTKREALGARHRDWAERLRLAGFIVLFPDSFGSRGVGPQCRVASRVARAYKERIGDAISAKAYLQSRPDVKPRAVSLLGWSNGGATVLNTIEARHDSGRGSPDFAKAIAFYPGCRTLLERGWTSHVPLLVLIGEADDWTPAAPCESLAAQAKSAGEPVSIVTYPGAYHDFDHPNLPVHTTGDLAFTADQSGTAHSGTNPAARADAIVRATAFLAR